MKRTAVLVNTSRGPIIHTEALVKALNEGTISGAALDVVRTSFKNVNVTFYFWQTDPEPYPVDGPLMHCKDCLILPHIGSATEETRNAMAMLAMKQLIQGCMGENLSYELLP
jgi:lactate dehydrogenase-like 2-hydroxyacid dehydrogenase